MKNFKELENTMKNKEIEEIIERKIEKDIENINSKLRIIRTIKMTWYTVIGSLTALSLFLFMFFRKYENGKELFDKISGDSFYTAVGFATIVTAFTETYTNYLENSLSRKRKE